MRLPRIIAFQIVFVLLNNDQCFCHPDHLHGLKIYHNPLALTVHKLNRDAGYNYDQLGDNGIEEIAETIIHEAEKRLKKRGLLKSSNNKKNQSDKEFVSKKIHGLLMQLNIVIPSPAPNIENDVDISPGDNIQVAKVNIFNHVDQQNNPSGKDTSRRVKLKSKIDYNHVNASSYVSPKTAYQQRLITTNKINTSTLDKFSFIAIIVACCVAGVAGIGLISFCWLSTEKKVLHHGKTGLHDESVGQKYITDEEKLVQGAEVYHYLHTKKQLQQIEEPNINLARCSINDSSDDDEENDEDTVYECPGLAPPGDMKVVNPLFSDTESHYSDPPSYQSTPTPPSEER